MDIRIVGLGALALAAAVALLLALVVLRTAPRASANRRLSAVLAFESLFVAILAIASWRLAGEENWPRPIAAVSFGAIVAISCAYLALLSILDTPLVRPLRHRAAVPVLAAFVILLSASGAVWGTPAENTDAVMIAVNGIVATTTIVGVGIFGILATVSAYRRTAPGSSARKRASTLLRALVTRDALWVLVILAGVILSTSSLLDLDQFLWNYAPGLIVLTYVPILAYGILRTQLFDIDLKIKVGIRRSTVVTAILVVALAAAKTAEFYLNRTYGWIAGGVAAGAMLVLAPRLNKMGDKVATVAMPQVRDTSSYVEFRKMEVYKAALESALEGGDPTPKERATLDRLRAKLGISEGDARALEADLHALAT